MGRSPTTLEEAEVGVPHYQAGRTTQGRAAARPIHSALPMERLLQSPQTRENFRHTSPARVDRRRSRTKGHDKGTQTYSTTPPPSRACRPGLPPRAGPSGTRATAAGTARLRRAARGKGALPQPYLLAEPG